ncbi:chemotaxis protein CheW [bacterium]|jgi:purine-binding chemotaxis protein CheW|nr:chemotaxis protein CheW [bacterium]
MKKDTDQRSEQPQDSLPAPGKFLTFLLENEKYGLAIESVKEIIRMQKTRPVPHFPDYLKGVISLRGHILALMDLRTRFSLPDAEYTDRTCIIVVSAKDKEIGLIVDTVADVTEFSSENLEPPPSITRSETSQYVRAMGKADDEVIIVLDLVQILAEDDLNLV